MIGYTRRSLPFTASTTLKTQVPNHQNKALATGLPVWCVQYIIHLTAAAKALTPRGRSNFPKLNNNKKAIRGRSQTSTGHKPFCSLSLTELSLFTRGRKFVGSRRNVISSDCRNLFIPVRSDCGLRRYDRNQVFQYIIQGQKKEPYGVAVAAMAGLPSKTMTRSAR